MNLMAATAPSSFGAPFCGHASVTTGVIGTTDARGTRGGFATTSVVRDRQAGVEADMGLALAYIPGTSAWSPPTS